MLVKKCALCGKLFTVNTNQHKAKYCSEECRKEAQRISHRNFKRKRKSKGTQSLSEFLAEIREYNQTHGTHLDYGQYELRKRLGKL